MAGSMSEKEFPIRAQIVKGWMFPRERASLRGMQTRSSLQMGAISTE